jgi:hypothetical protein
VCCCTDEVPDHDEARRDPDPHLQWARRHGRELWHCLDQSKSGANRALGTMLVRLRVTEIGQDAVAWLIEEAMHGPCHMAPLIDLFVGEPQNAIDGMSAWSRAPLNFLYHSEPLHTTRRCSPAN